MTKAMLPQLFKVRRRVQETSDVVTFEISPQEQGSSPGCAFAPGQFNMLYGFGLGESAISISGDCEQQGFYTHTIRAVGNVTNALCAVQVGDTIGVRGPFGVPWPVEKAFGKTLLLVTGGIGLAPLRPALYFAAKHREKFKNVILLVGARSPQDLLFPDELETWKRENNFVVEVTVDHADANWNGHVGVVPKLLSKVEYESSETIAMMCGPEIMMRYSFAPLLDKGVPRSQIFVSMERNMKCAIAQCGHCQYGPYFICKDGPVFSLDQIESYFLKREL